MCMQFNYSKKPEIAKLNPSRDSSLEYQEETENDIDNDDDDDLAEQNVTNVSFLLFFWHVYL